MESKLLERVRKLLNKAEAEGCTDEEAQALTAKAAELMAKYGIDKAMLAATQPQTDTPIDKRIMIPNPWAKVHAHLLCGLGQALRCEPVLIQVPRGACVHVFGYTSDVERLELLYTSILLQLANGVLKYEQRLLDMERELQSIKGSISPDDKELFERVAKFVLVSPGRKKANRRSYMLGFISSVITRVKAAEKTALDEVKREKGSGAELVLADRSLVAKSKLRATYPQTRTVRTTYTGSGYDQGHADGRNANIGGASVGNRTAGALH